MAIELLRPQLGLDELKRAEQIARTWLNGEQ